MKEETLHMGKLIKQKLIEHDRTISWLAKKLDCSNSTLSRQLKQQHLYADLMFDISMALEEDLFVYYSQILMESGVLHKMQ